MPRAEMLSQPRRSLCDCNKFIVRIAAVSKLLSLRGSAVKGISPPPRPENFVFRGKPLCDCKVLYISASFIFADIVAAL